MDVTSTASFAPRRKGLALLAAAVVGFLPAAAEGANLAFRNDTDSPLLVQGVTIINRVVRRGKLHILRPGEVSRELILVPGTVVISVADGNQPARILAKTPVQFTGTDLFFAIQIDEPEKSQDQDKTSAKAKDRKAPILRVRLVPIKPTLPANPPRR